MNHIRELLSPGRRTLAEAKARLRYLMIVESNINGLQAQPTDKEINRIVKRIKLGESSGSLFPASTRLSIEADDQNFVFSLKLTRSEGLPVHMVSNEEAEQAMAVREVNLLDRYSLSLNALADHLGFTAPRTTALVLHLGLREDSESFREFAVGKSRFGRYSQRALTKLRGALEEHDMDLVWTSYREKVRARRSTMPQEKLDSA